MNPDDRVLVAVMNSLHDWDLVQAEHWYRLPVKHAPPGAPDFDWVAFYFTRVFDADRWAIHYYAPIEGHELVTRRDLMPHEPDHPRACQWYYQLQLGPILHKLPPIAGTRYRRLTFIVTSGDRFVAAGDISELLLPSGPDGRPYVVLREE